MTSTNHRLAIANDAPLFFSPDAPRVTADWVMVNITRYSLAVETPQTRTRAPGLKRDPAHQTLVQLLILEARLSKEEKMSGTPPHNMTLISIVPFGLLPL